MQHQALQPKSYALWMEFCAAPPQYRLKPEGYCIAVCIVQKWIKDFEEYDFCSSISIKNVFWKQSNNTGRKQGFDNCCLTLSCSDSLLPLTKNYFHSSQNFFGLYFFFSKKTWHSPLCSWWWQHTTWKTVAAWHYIRCWCWCGLVHGWWYIFMTAWSSMQCYTHSILLQVLWWCVLAITRFSSCN